MKNYRLITVLVFSLFSQSARAEQIDVNALSEFTRSVTRLWVSSEMCKNSIPDTVQFFSTPIKTYVSQFYMEGAPYWALPIVEQRIEDDSSCALKLEQNLIMYQNASREFRKLFPRQPRPPQLNAYVRQHTPQDMLDQDEPRRFFIAPAIISRR